jgi:predicted ATPase/class 3 adenylate cyclase
VPNDGRPTGTVTFLFTDIEGSTKLWERHPGEMAQALARHDEIVRSVVALHGGVIFATGGDGFAIAFARASDGVSAAMGLQRALGLESWPEPLRLSVRAGLHTGEAIERNGDYFGPAVNRAARLMAAAHGDQIVCSETTQGVLRGQLAGEVRVEELGRIRLRGFSVSERIFGIFGPGLRQEFAPLADLDSEVGSRPGPPDLLIGRAQELDQIVELLASRRVVTLTGTGGVGKTTLALAAIDRVSEKFPDGVWWVDLAPIRAHEDILPVIASIVHVRDQRGEGLVAALSTALSDQRMLLVLDNCEHVLHMAAELVGHLVSVCPGVVVLSTSRVRLGVQAERDLPIRPLHVDGERSAALELLVERIGRPGIDADSEVRAALEDITRRLDGLPLALELAAARCRTMPPGAVAQRLRDRIRLPASRDSTAGSRATLDGTVQWSYDLLNSSEQMVLARLSVFAGTFSLDAAMQVVCSNSDLDPFEAEDAITALVEHSLIEHEDGRYRMLETTRQFANSRLAEGDDKARFEAAHVAWVLLFLKEVRAGVRGPNEAQWVDRMDTEWANIRVAFQRSMEFDDPDVSSELVLLMFIDAGFRRPEASGWILQAYQRNGSVRHTHRHELIGAAGWLTWEKGDPEGALALGRQAMAADPAPGTAIDRLPEWAFVAGLAFTGEPAKAGRIITSVLASVSTDPFLEVLWNYLFTLTCELEGNPGGGSESAAIAERISRSLNNPTALALAAWARATAIGASDPTRNAELLSVAIDHCRSVRLTLLEQALEQRALGLRRLLGYPAIETLHKLLEHARLFARNGLMMFGWPQLVPMAFCLHELGHDRQAAVCLYVRNQSPVHATHQEPVETLLRTLTETLGTSEMATLELEASGLDFLATLNLAESLI